MSEADNSILIDVKKVLGISEDYNHFDRDLIMYINAAFSSLIQIGIGNVSTFEISDSNTPWSAFVTDSNVLSLVKNYVSYKTRLAFDPPSTSYAIEAINKAVQELEYRMYIYTDKATKEVFQNGQLS